MRMTGGREKYILIFGIETHKINRRGKRFSRKEIGRNALLFSREIEPIESIYRLFS